MLHNSLRNILLGATLSLPVVSFSIPQVLAQDVRDFTVNNTTGQTMTELYVSPTQRNSWGPDILGMDVLPSRQSTDVKFNPSTTSEGCIYDIRAQWANGTSTDLYGYNLCTLNAVNFSGAVRALW